jgi:hypothetical protein
LIFTAFLNVVSCGEYTRTPALSTLHPALKALDEMSFETALVNWVRQTLVEEDQGYVGLEPTHSRRHAAELPGAELIASFSEDIRRSLLQRALSQEEPIGAVIFIT